MQTGEGNKVTGDDQARNLARNKNELTQYKSWERLTKVTQFKKEHVEQWKLQEVSVPKTAWTQG